MDRRNQEIVAHEQTQSEAMLQAAIAALDGAPNSIVITDRQGAIEWVNSAFTKLTGYAAPEAIGRTTQFLKSGKHSDRFYEEMWNTIVSGAVWHGEVVNRRKDESLYVEEMTITPIRSAEGSINHFIAVKEDITARKLAQEELRQSKERLDFALQAAALGEWSLDLKTQTVHHSLRHDQIFGYSSLLPEWSYSLFLEHVLPEYRAAVDEKFKEALDRTGVWEFEAPIRWPDGTLHWIAVRGRVSYDNSGAPALLLGIVSDITDRKIAEGALVRSEKLASVGRMAAVIAHEINNPLAAAMNALFLVRTDPAVPEGLKSNLDLVEQELARISHVTKQTLGFCRVGGNLTAVDLPKALDSILNVYGSRLKNRNISVKCRYRGSPGVRAIEGDVCQIGYNLIGNSIDALPQNGTLQVRLFGPQVLRGHRRMVRMTVADNGEGIAAENLKRVVEPFFTTKQSIGTGLGLWATSELVKKYEGKLRIRSKVAKGTVVTVWLPLERRSQERRIA
jgi:PAS domain S-box-containing protein